MSQRSPLERASWIATIIAAFLAGWALLSVPEQQKAPAPTAIINGSGNTIVQGSTVESTVRDRTSSPKAEKPPDASPATNHKAPLPISVETAHRCLRSSPGFFTNYCKFSIAVTWCFSIGQAGGPWEQWDNADNSCEAMVRQVSPPIAPNARFPFPRQRQPISPDGKWEAGLIFLDAVRM
jgi:hypothetical protein